MVSAAAGMHPLPHDLDACTLFGLQYDRSDQLDGDPPAAHHCRHRHRRETELSEMPRPGSGAAGRQVIE